MYGITGNASNCLSLRKKKLMIFLCYFVFVKQDAFAIAKYCFLLLQRICGILVQHYLNLHCRHIVN